MSAREMARWIAYFECIEPIPDQTRDAAQICWTLAMVNGAKGAKIADFMAKPPRAPQKGQSVEEMMAAFGRATE